MKVLPIVWQRLVDDEGRTCPRCAATGAELLRAVETLRGTLEPLGIQPRLEIQPLDMAAFRDRPEDSNRVLIAGKPMEAWLGATTGASPCCDQCGDSDCRTVQFEGRSYETIPESLLVRAGVVAAARMLQPQPCCASTPCR